jgi:hypothetical protein
MNTTPVSLNFKKYIIVVSYKNIDAIFYGLTLSGIRIKLWLKLNCSPLRVKGRVTNPYSSQIANLVLICMCKIQNIMTLELQFSAAKLIQHAAKFAHSNVHTTIST